MRIRSAAALLTALALLTTVSAGRALLGDPARERRLDLELLEGVSYTPYSRYRGPARPILRASSLGPRVGLQAGHWRMEEMPDELARLRDNTGASWGSFSEATLNRDVAGRVKQILEARGVWVDLLPGAIPPNYDADAFVAIHADGAWRPGARGWKLSTPWRTSDASRHLEHALGERYAAVTGLPEDRYGVTYNMKGYYGFSPHRFRHAISPFTPAVILEMGFVTTESDRVVLYEQTDLVARGIATGILDFLTTHTRLDWRSRTPVYYPARRTAVDREVALQALPEGGGPVRRTLPPGTHVVPVHRENGWVEIIVRGNYRSWGWVPVTDLDRLP